MNFYYQEMLRATWGFSNPNHAAALIAAISPFFWLLACRFKWGFWAALGLFLVSGILLIDTFSRGGAVAFLFGHAVALSTTKLFRNRIHLASIILAVTALFGYANFQTATSRYADAWQGDASVKNRLTLWKTIPKMLADAPKGWGRGNAHIAYMNWYQPLQHHERFRNLVSLHLTTLVEYNLFWRCIYILSWIIAFLVAFPYRSSGVPAVYFGSLLAFFISGTFTDFEGVMKICFIPLAATVAAIAHRIYIKSPLPQAHLYVAFFATAILTFCVHFRFSRTSSPHILASPSFVQIGSLQQPDAWIFVDSMTMGLFPGKTLRRYIREGNEIAAFRITESLTDIPRDQTLIMGSLKHSLLMSELTSLRPSRLILLNPLCSPEEISKHLGDTEVHAVFGWHAKSNVKEFWLGSNQATIIDGSGDYIQNWPEALTKLILKKPYEH